MERNKIKITHPILDSAKASSANIDGWLKWEIGKV